MLAQAAMNHGLMDVISELMTYQHGNGFYRVAVPDNWIGRSFQDAFGEWKRNRNVILVGVQSPGERMRVNPDEYVFQAGDEVVVISAKEIKL
jgi:voltage-gated potassium channel